MGQKMLMNLSEKIADEERRTRIGRMDLNLTSYEALGDSTARIMLEYLPERGVPRESQVRDWVQTSLEGKFKLLLASVENYQDLGVVTAVVQSTADPHPLWYADKMIRMGANRYMDEDHDIWEMRETDDGTKFLVRATGDDVMAILEERSRRQRVAYTRRPVMDDVRIAAYDTGDKVRYLAPNGMQQIGKITSVGQDTVKIDNQVIDKSMVIAIEEKSPAAEKKNKKDLNKLLTEMYGKEIADGLTK
jgi:hypothetical protein